MGSSRFIVDRCLDFIKENGDAEQDIVIKTDQEPAIQLLVREVVEARDDGRTTVEESPVKFMASSSGSAGVVGGLSRMWKAKYVRYFVLD